MTTEQITFNREDFEKFMEWYELRQGYDSREMVETERGSVITFTFREDGKIVERIKAEKVVIL